MDRQSTQSVPRKSEKLSKEELALLKKYLKGFNTVIECADAIGIHRNVLDRVILAGSGSPDTISKIRTAIGA